MNNYVDNCDLCGSDDVDVDDFGYALCYACYIAHPEIQKEMFRLATREEERI